jgi:hypothetical protein
MENDVKDALLYILESLDSILEMSGAMVESYPDYNFEYLNDLLTSARTEVEVMAQKAEESGEPAEPAPPVME